MQTTAGIRALSEQFLFRQARPPRPPLRRGRGWPPRLPQPAVAQQRPVRRHRRRRVRRRRRRRQHPDDDRRRRAPRRRRRVPEPAHREGRHRRDDLRRRRSHRMSTQSQYLVTVTVDGRPIGVFDTRSGGEVEADVQKRKVGGGRTQTYPSLRHPRRPHRLPRVRA
ncbi:hypothetical protein [Nocardioides convexus]|uniref:hypothetical protein n=1 Tax=Nocardioides convexus TaxID=2712224 RepID=UPI00241848A4|nr:hypothetical protein [Nocardioides convexus]